MAQESTQKVLLRLAETLVNVALALESIGLNGSVPRKNKRNAPTPSKKRSTAQRKSWKKRHASIRSKKVWDEYTPEQRAARVAKTTSARMAAKSARDNGQKQS